MNTTTISLDRSFGPAVARPVMNQGPIIVASAAIALCALYLNAAVSGRQALLFLVGAAAGLALYHAAFGFTSAWRMFITDGRGAGIRAQMLMLALTCVVFFPALAGGHAFGQTLRGSVSPVGVSVVVGAFLFGVGMHLCAGSASGTLYSSVGGKTRKPVTFGTCISGLAIGSAHMPVLTA